MRNEQIYNSWSKIKPDAAAHERMLANILDRPQERSVFAGLTRNLLSSGLKIIAPIAACIIVLMVVFIPRIGVETPPVAVTPLPVEEVLTMDQARSCQNFGTFLPSNMPERFSLDRVWRYTHEDNEMIFALWYSERDTITWQISNATAHDLSLVVDVNDRAKFDLSLYTVPWFESVPHDLIQYVMNSVFLAHEITIDMVQARAVESRSGGVQMNFGILFDNIVVTINATGLSPTEVWEMILQILNY